MTKDKLLQLLEKEIKRYSELGDKHTANILSCVISLVEQLELKEEKDESENL